MNHKDQRYSFFVIEDSRGDYVLIEEYLNEQFSRPSVTHAMTFQEAEDIFESDSVGRFDCIILDLSLPDKSGKDLIDEVLRLSEGLPVVVLTGYTNLSFSVQFLEQGISDYLLKDELSPSLLHKSIIYSIKRNEFSKRIQESEEKYRTLFELSPEAMWLADSETGEFLDVNRAAILHYGYSREEFLSMSITDLQTSKSPTLSGHFANGTLDEEPVGEVNYVSHQKKSGDVIKVSIESSQIDYQGRKAGLYLVKDVTEKLKDEKRRRLLESVVRNTNDAVAILNVAPDAPHPNIIYTNASFRTITGYTDDDVRNRSLSLLTGEQTDPKQLSILENAINNYESADLELIQYTKEGETFWAHVSLVPVEDSDGGHNHMVAIFRDITSRKESEEKIQASLREKEVLLSEIHHRVKNNLALVSGMLQMQVFDEENQEVINKLNNSMLRVETMASIHQLLYESSSFSRLEFSKIISKLIKATHRSFSAGKDIDIEIETEPFELLSAVREHFPGEVQADHFAGLEPALRLDGEIGGSGCNVEHTDRAFPVQELDGLAAPVPVDPEAEDAVQEVVAGCHGVEHVLDRLGLSFDLTDGGMT